MSHKLKLKHISQARRDIVSYRDSAWLLRVALVVSGAAILTAGVLLLIGLLTDPGAPGRDRLLTVVRLISHTGMILALCATVIIVLINSVFEMSLGEICEELDEISAEVKATGSYRGWSRDEFFEYCADISHARAFNISLQTVIAALAMGLFFLVLGASARLLVSGVLSS